MDKDGNNNGPHDIAQALEVCRAENRELVYVLSHDLREPLRMVTSYIELFSGRYREQLDDDAGEFIRYALDGAHRAELMLDGLLDYSRVVNAPIKRECVVVDGVVQRVLEWLQADYLDVTFDVERGRLPELAGDERLLRRLWYCLLDNAVKFRDPQRPLKIGIDVARLGDDWRFRVTDNGIGFDPRQVDRIFGIFNTLHPVGRYPGVGIGLAVSRRIVERLGGALGGDARVGEGAEFVFTLPALD